MTIAALQECAVLIVHMRTMSSIHYDGFWVDRDLLMEVSDDLNLQAMLFDMDIDWETLQLVEKRKDDTPKWLKRWREKLNEQDYNAYYDER